MEYKSKQIDTNNHANWLVQMRHCSIDDAVTYDLHQLTDISQTWKRLPFSIFLKFDDLAVNYNISTKALKIP